MQKVLTAEEMREVDRQTTEKYGIPSLLLMENAAHAVASAIKAKLGGSVTGKSILILCGKGNNGGDGAALARILWTQGANCFVKLLGKVEETKNDARTNFEIIHHISQSRETNAANENCLFLDEVSDIREITQIIFEAQEDVLIDAIFGTGLSRPVENGLKELFEKLRKWQKVERIKFLTSLDTPSGLNANISEAIGENIQADLTVTFTAPKLANVFPPAANFNGELIIANIGSPQELIDNCPSKLYLAEKQDIQKWLRSTKLQPDSYKKTRGTVLVIAGSENYAGAAVLAANAGFAAGAGMVTVTVPKQIHQIVAAKTADEIIVKPLQNIDILQEKVDVVALGCGLASDEATHQQIRETVENRQAPMILDAEALNALSPFTWQGSEELPLILTPHIGEFARLLGRKVGTDKIEEARQFAVKHNLVLVLKGERSLIGCPDGKVVINPTGTAGISRAGAGDTLTGIIAGFLAQTLAVKETSYENAVEAVVAALYLAGIAGEIAAVKFSERLMSATDIRECLKEAIERVEK